MPDKNRKRRATRRKSAATTTQPKGAAKKASTRGTKAAKAKASKKQAAQASGKRTSTNQAARAEPIVNLGRLFVDLDAQRRIKLRVSFRRPDDLLVCEFIFDNLKLEDRKLVRLNPNRPSTLIVELPPQSFGEQAFLDPTDPEVPNEPPANEKFQESSKKAPPKNVVSNEEPHGDLPFAKIRMSGPSRLAFAMPPAVTDLPFTLDAILDACRKWPMRLSLNALPEPPSILFLDDPSHDRRIFDKNWLRTATSSSEWAKATQTLVAAIRGENDLERTLAAAAKRIANHAAEALGMGVSRDLPAEISRAMNGELDSIARKFQELRQEKPREIALAALSLMSTQALALTPVGTFTFESIAQLPFLTASLSPHEPSSTVTALELPYRLITSPIPAANWWHQTKPVVHNGRTELWHTRLTQTTDGFGVDPARNIRALWSPDYPLQGKAMSDAIGEPPPPFRMSLDALDRQMLVQLMSDFNAADIDGNPYLPRAARSQRLALSALGGLVDVEGNWNFQPGGVGIEQWRHLATLGRDHYVRVVYKGFLCPSGHAASLIKVTERKFEFEKQGSKNRVALLRQKFFIIVREPVRQYDGTGHEFEGRNFPFTSLEILTRVTPNLRPPGECKLNDPQGKIYATTPKVIPPRACFWPKINASTYFKFQVAATDRSGDRVTYPMPLLFVGVEANQNNDSIAEIIVQYDKDPVIPQRTSALGGCSVCYAPLKQDAEGDTRLPTAEMTFAVAPVTTGSKNKPRFYPETQTARVGIAAIQRLLQQPNAMVGVAYSEKYKSDGFGGSNPGEIFLRTLQPFELTFGAQVKSDSLGGLATPSMAIQGLSRIMGPVAAKPPASSDAAAIETALGQVYNNNFNPADFFKGAKILGGIELKDILGVLPKPLAGQNVPKLLSKTLGDKIEARFDWNTEIHDTDPKGLFVHTAGGQKTVLDMHGVVSSPIGQPGATTFEAVASIKNFKVNLFGFITIWFDQLSFTSKSGSKPDVSVDLHPGDKSVEFGGPLEFVNALKDIIPSDGFSDPPSLAVTPSGISASYSLNVPSVAVGIFALEHVSLGAGFMLPFDGKPAEVRFNFSERQRPFSLTVSLLGGGGFFAICIGAEGVREIEAALEFGAALSINLGVASGSVEIKAGVYFHWKLSSVELAGYIRLHGELSVLGLISASLTFNLQLAYLKDKAKHSSVVWGEASIEVEIEILFLSFSVSVKCRREFGGSNSDPKFIALIPDASTWTDYCEAFAAEAA